MATNTVHGFQISVTDPGMQAFLQKWPFLCSPDPEMNRLGAAAIVRGLHIRQTGHEPRRVLLSTELSTLSVQEQERVLAFFNALQISTERRRQIMDDFAWEANMAPRDANNVLIVGCGDGAEMVFLRAVLPKADFMALNYVDLLTPAMKEVVRTKLMVGDMHAHFDQLAGGYDLITSNHTLEHMYDPDKTLAALYRLLRPGGTLISTLPLDGTVDSPFRQVVKRVVDTKRVHPIDMVFLDAGHPWKTNPADLNQALTSVGFESIALYQRVSKITRQVAGGRQKLDSSRKIGLFLHAMCFGLPHAFGRLLPEGKIQILYTRVLLRLERVVWFGTNSLKNRYTEETLFQARKPAP
jgi:SAM-dependent methyltransferase